MKHFNEVSKSDLREGKAKGLGKLAFVAIFVMSVLASAEIDLFVPSFPELRRVFDLSPFMMEFSLGVNLISYCLCSLLVGGLGDKFGRKPVIISGIAVFIIGSCCCICASEYWQILLGRALQGVGISAPACLGYVIIADAYPISRQQQLIGVLNGYITLATTVFPISGSYISLIFGWRGSFVALLTLGLVSLVLAIFFLPRESVAIRDLSTYRGVFRSNSAFYYILVMSFCALPPYLFSGISPILFMDDLGVSLKNFGFYQGSVTFCFAITSLLNGYCLRRFGHRKCLCFAACLFLLFIFGSICIISLNITSPLIITLCMCLLAVGIVHPQNILYPLALRSVPGAKSKIAALMVAGRILFSTLGLQSIGYFYNGTFAPLGIAMCLAITASFLFSIPLLLKGEIFKQPKS